MYNVKIYKIRTETKRSMFRREAISKHTKKITLYNEHPTFDA